jgi:hypothetical protein
MGGALTPLLLYASVAWRGTISPFTPIPRPPNYLLRPECSFRLIVVVVVVTCPPAPCIFMVTFRNVVPITFCAILRVTTFFVVGGFLTTVF